MICFNTPCISETMFVDSTFPKEPFYSAIVTTKTDQETCRKYRFLRVSCPVSCIYIHGTNRPKASLREIHIITLQLNFLSPSDLNLLLSCSHASVQILIYAQKYLTQDEYFSQNLKILMSIYQRGRNGRENVEIASYIRLVLRLFVWLWLMRNFAVMVCIKSVQ